MVPCLVLKINKGLRIFIAMIIKIISKILSADLTLPFSYVLDSLLFVVIKFIHTEHSFCQQQNSNKRTDSNQSPLDTVIQSIHILLSMFLIFFLEHLPCKITRESMLKFSRKRVRFISSCFLLCFFGKFIGVSVVKMSVIVTFMDFFDIRSIFNFAIYPLKFLSLS